jgi:hypothetical protein
VPCLFLAWVALAGAGEPTPEERKWVKTLLEALDGNSPRVRKGAEEALAAMGVDALPAIVELLPTVKGNAATRGLYRALERMGRAEVIARLERMKEGLTKQAAKRIEDLLQDFGGTTAPGVPSAVPLVRARLETPELAPLAAEAPVAGRLPIVTGVHAARDEQGSLRLDADGDGASETTIPLGQSRVVEVGAAKAPLLLYAKRGTWHACSASLLRGGTGSSAVEFLDADLDGEFAGARDHVRVADGAFGLQHAVRRLPLAEGIATYQVRREGDGFALSLTALPRPAGLDETQWAGLLALNRHRASMGLAPVLTDASRCAGCQKHARYLELNAGTPEIAGLSAHQELPGKPGYTPEGATAAGTTVVHFSPSVDAAFGSFLSTMLHRTSLLCDAGFAVGIGTASSAKGATVFWGEEPRAEGGAPRVVPAPGQRRVSLRGGGELPVPTDAPDWYDQPRGYPVSAHTQGLALADVTLKLYVGSGSSAVPGRLWTPQRPVVAGHGGTGAFFMPAAPLEAKQAYVAELAASSDSGPVRWVWTFRTD